MPKLIKKLNSFFDGLRAKITRRSVILFSVLALIMIIPTIFAIYFAYFYEDNSFLSYNNVSIELYDSEGVLLFSDEASKSDIGNHADLKMFYDIKTNATLISEKPTAERVSEYRLVYSEGDTSLEYICRFAEKATASLLENSSGELFSVPAEPYGQFLLTAYSEKVHSTSVPPVLFTGDEHTVLPSEVSWSYKRGGGFVKSKNYKAASSLESYPISGAINLAFDKAPDYCTAEVYGLDGKHLYSGALAELSSLSFEVGETVRVKLSANWKNNGTSVCFVELKYDFYVLLATQAKFSVSATELTAGELLVISVKNAQDINRIKYSPDLSANDSYILSDAFEYYSKEKLDAVNTLYDFEPKFSDAGDTKLAIIPLPANLPSGRFVFTISSGASSESFNIKINAHMQKEYGDIGKTEAEIGEAATLRQFEKLSASLEKPRQDIIYYSSAFELAVDNRFNGGYSFGNKVLFSDGELNFSALGNEYTSSTLGGQSVSVLNTGIVVASGYSDTLGNYVAVEHGLGIRTWYCFLSDVSAREGDILKKGDVIGKSGNGSALSGDGFLLLCSVHDVAADPNFILGKTFLAANNE